MLKLLPGVSSWLGVAVVAIPAAALSGGAAWFARGLIYETYEKPALIKLIETRERDGCVIRTQAAAAAAEDAVEEKWRRIAAESNAAYRLEFDADEEARVKVAEKRAAERVEYEAQRIAEGRVCTFTDADYDRVYGAGP